MTARQERASLAAEILDRAHAKLGRAPRYRSGTCESTTDPFGDVLVRIDGRSQPVGSDADEAAVEDLGAAIYCRVLCDPPADGQRVLVMLEAGGQAWVIGSHGGSPNILGGQPLFNTGAAVPIASSADTQLHDDGDGLSCNVEVPHLRHWVEVEVQAVISAAAAGAAYTGRIWRADRTDAGENDDVENFVQIGRWAIGDDLPDGNGRLLSGKAVDLIDPGSYRYSASISVVGGFVIRQNFTGGTDMVVGHIKVTDEGPIPADIAWPDDVTYRAEKAAL